MGLAIQHLRVRARIARPALTLLATLAIAMPVAGCWKSPRNKAPFTLSNPSERHPISVEQSEALLDLSVSGHARQLNDHRLVEAKFDATRGAFVRRNAQERFMVRLRQSLGRGNKC